MAALFTFMASSPFWACLIVFLFGACVGSFLNVVIWRLPKMMRHNWHGQCVEFLQEAQAKLPPEQAKTCLLCQQACALPLPERSTTASTRFDLCFPASHCPQCQHTLAWYDNIPLLSYLLLRGRCRYCQYAIPWRYPVIECLSGLLPVGLWWIWGPTWTFLAVLLLGYVLLVLTVIDLDHQFLPDDVVLPTLWLGLLLNTQDLFVPLIDAIWGAVIGYLSLWTVYQAFKLLTGKEGMGYGDFKLLSMLGAWLGWKHLPFVILGSSLLGAIVGLTLVCRGQDKNVPFAFGPYLSAAGFTVLLYGDAIAHWYWH